MRGDGLVSGARHEKVGLEDDTLAGCHEATRSAQEIEGAANRRAHLLRLIRLTADDGD
jgi:hypothetical protein